MTVKIKHAKNMTTERAATCKQNYRAVAADVLSIGQFLVLLC